MSVSLPNGSIVSIASGYGAVTTMTAVSNASTAIAILSGAHTIVTGDLMEVTSGWSRLNSRIVRAGTVGSPSAEVPLEGQDTSLTTIYPAGSGIGSIREITGWTQLSQILESTSDGGEQQFATYQFLEGDSQNRIPTVKNALGLTFKIADDPTLAGYILASTANDDRLPRAVKVLLPSGALIFYDCYISLNKTPSLTVNEVMAVQATLSLLSEPVRYTS